MPGDVSKKSKQKADLLENHTCPICMYLLIEPVTLPCEHELCLSCFQQNVQESLCCPMCRCRISSWIRRQARLNNLVNQERWKQIKALFPEKVRLRLEGYEDDLEDDEEEESHSSAPRLAEPGEIRQEYEKALQKLAEERDAERRREEDASAALLRTLQEEEKRTKKEMERLESQLKKDEELARLLEAAGTPALRRKVEEEAKGDNQNIQVLLSKLHENESADASDNNNSSSTPSVSSDTSNSKRKASPVSPSQNKQPRLIQVSSRQPVRKSSEAHVRTQSSISGNRISHTKKQKSKLNIVDHFEKIKSFQSVGQPSPNSVSASPTKNTDAFTINCKASQSLSESAIHNDSTNIIATGASNKIGRKILFEKKLNFDKCDSKSGVSNLRSRTKGSLKSSQSACNGTKLDMYFKQREKSVCEAYMAGEASRSSEEKDRLFALALQKQYDMELKMSRQVNRAKGTSDEYKLRQKAMSEEKDEEVTDKCKRKSLCDKSQKKIKT